MKKMKTMTEGVIWKEILFFAIPLILGNLFQQLYNTVDSIIVGNYVGSNALAAVGSSGAIINLLIGFCIGASTGAGVVISQFYGAKNTEGVRKGRTYYDGDRAGSRSASDCNRNYSDTIDAAPDGNTGQGI